MKVQQVRKTIAVTLVLELHELSAMRDVLNYVDRTYDDVNEGHAPASWAKLRDDIREAYGEAAGTAGEPAT